MGSDGVNGWRRSFSASSAAAVQRNESDMGGQVVYIDQGKEEFQGCGLLGLGFFFVISV